MQHLLDCNILASREEVEDLTGAAVKEEQIETKLGTLEGEWSQQSLVFAEYKTRGPVILKGSDTAELIEKLEDSQMTLGSMATNRCVWGPSLWLLVLVVCECMKTRNVPWFSLQSSNTRADTMQF